MYVTRRIEYVILIHHINVEGKVYDSVGTNEKF